MSGYQRLSLLLASLFLLLLPSWVIAQENTNPKSVVKTVFISNFDMTMLLQEDKKSLLPFMNAYIPEGVTDIIPVISLNTFLVRGTNEVAINQFAGILHILDTPLYKITLNYQVLLLPRETLVMLGVPAQKVATDFTFTRVKTAYLKKTMSAGLCGDVF